jgi:hypothetical protein
LGTEVNGQYDSTSTLSSALYGIGSVYDKILTDADSLLNIWDDRRCPTSLLTPLLQTVGMPVEPALGPKSARALIRNAQGIYSRKGNSTGIRLFAEAASGVDALVQMGTNLLPSASASNFQKITSISTTLATAIDATQTTIQVTSVAGLPIGNKQLSVDKNILLWIGTSTANEAVWVSGRAGNILTVIRGAHGTAASTFAQGAAVRYDVNPIQWTMSTGYALQATTDSGVTAPTVTSTDSNQLPLNSGYLKITKATGSTGYAPTLRFGVRRNILFYSRINRIGTIRTTTPHNLVPGQQFTAMLGSVGATAWTAASYRVLSVTSATVFTFTHSETGLSDVYMPITDQQAPSTVPPYIDAFTPATMIGITASTAYTFSGQLRTAVTARTANASINWYDQYGTYLSASTPTSVSDTTSWTQFTHTATSPSSAAFAELVIAYTAAWASNEIHYASLMQLQTGSSATTYQDGGLVRVGLNGPASMDTTRAIRTRVAALLPSQATSDNTYRVEFLNRGLNLTSTQYAKLVNSSGAAFVNTAPTILDIRLRINLPAYNAAQTLVSQAGASLAQPIWQIQLSSAGGIQFKLTVGGTTTTSTLAATGATNGTAYWYRCLVNSTTGAVQMWRLADQQTEPVWGTATSTFTLTQATGLQTSFTASDLTIGSSSGGLSGSVLYARSVVGVQNLWVFDPWKIDTTYLTASNPGTLGGTWQIVGPTSSTVVSTSFP